VKSEQWLRYGFRWWGIPERGKKFFSSLPYRQLVPSSVLAVKQLGHEPDQFPATIAEVRNRWRYASTR
jgi:hypothetical protein